jgi:hypothetical protein
MQGVPALEISDPVVLGILVESGDAAGHGVASRRVRTQGRIPLQVPRRCGCQRPEHPESTAGARLGVIAPN